MDRRQDKKHKSHRKSTIDMRLFLLFLAWNDENKIIH